MSTTFFYLNSFLSFSSHLLAAGFLGLIALQFYILSSIFFVVSPPCNSLYLVPLLFSPPCNSIFCLLNSIFFVVSLLCVVEGFLGLTALQQPPAACLRQPSGHAPFAAHILAGIIITIIITTRPEPAYGRQGLVGSLGQDTDQAGTFWGVLNVSLRASSAQLGFKPTWNH